jgi:hypothetical protein
MECRSECGDRPKLRVDLRSEEPPYHGVVPPDLAREIGLGQAGVDPQIIEALHDRVHLDELSARPLIFGAERRVLKTLIHASPMVTSVEHRLLSVALMLRNCSTKDTTWSRFPSHRKDLLRGRQQIFMGHDWAADPTLVPEGFNNPNHAARRYS